MTVGDFIRALNNLNIPDKGLAKKRLVIGTNTGYIEIVKSVRINTFGDIEISSRKEKK